MYEVFRDMCFKMILWSGSWPYAEEEKGCEMKAFPFLTIRSHYYPLLYTNEMDTKRNQITQVHTNGESDKLLYINIIKHPVTIKVIIKY